MSKTASLNINSEKLDLPGNISVTEKLEAHVKSSSEVALSEFTPEEIEFLNAPVQPQKWYQWFSPSDSREEKILVAKLDLLVWLYLFLSSFVKTLDSTAISYSYVSGMKEDLGMYGNQYTYQSSCYMAGFIFGQIPLTMLATRFPINLYLPIVDTIWSIFTLAMFKLTNYHQLYAIRFCIGFLGSFFFPTAQYILGCWYTKSEITKRLALFFCASQIGSMSGGYMQAAAVTSLSGKGGIEGWQWLFLLAFIITIPITMYGIFALPGLPGIDNSTVFKILTPREYRLGELRMIREGRTAKDKLSWNIIKETIFGWKFIVLVTFAIFFSQADGISSYAGLQIWLKEEGYSTAKVNTITTVQPAVTIVTAVVNGIIVDTYQNSHAIVIAVTNTINLIAAIILTVWHGVGKSGIMAAFFLAGSADGIAAVLYSWANIICLDNSQKRAITLATMNTLGNTFGVWVPLFVWKTVDAPRYLKGYAYNIALCSAMFVFLVPLTVLWKREQKRTLNK